MRRTNCRIAFNDLPLMLLGIPLLSFIVPIVFFSCRFDRPPYLSWKQYAVTICVISILWVSNRYILIWCRKRFPLFRDVRKRLFIQSTAMLGFTIAGDNFLHMIIVKFIFANDILAFNFQAEELINRTAADVFCVITIMCIYESIYFMHALKDSVEEKEMLKRASLHAELDALRSQVNPHFLFNNLNTLSSLIPENPKHAVDFVQQLSKVYRHVLEVKDEESIDLKDELEVLNAYSFLLKTRFGNNLDVRINIPEEKMRQRIVPLSLQILMENAIKHNVVSSDKPLRIDVYTENGSLVLKNNLQVKRQISESTGIGLNNIRNRYRLLSDKEVKVTDNENSFTVSIPLIES
ncbi:MAG TPA: histidine kinase [Ferruginibacter sp.]|nr:histidine kinase [Ferruginibacter sp.]